MRGRHIIYLLSLTGWMLPKCSPYSRPRHKPWDGTQEQCERSSSHQGELESCQNCSWDWTLGGFRECGMQWVPEGAPILQADVCPEDQPHSCPTPSSPPRSGRACTSSRRSGRRRAFFLSKALLPVLTSTVPATCSPDGSPEHPGLRIWCSFPGNAVLSACSTSPDPLGLFVYLYCYCSSCEWQHHISEDQPVSFPWIPSPLFPFLADHGLRKEVRQNTKQNKHKQNKNKSLCKHLDFVFLCWTLRRWIYLQPHGYSETAWGCLCSLGGDWKEQHVQGDGTTSEVTHDSSW